MIVKAVIYNCDYAFQRHVTRKYKRHREKRPAYALRDNSKCCYRAENIPARYPSLFYGVSLRRIQPIRSLIIKFSV